MKKFLSYVVVVGLIVAVLAIVIAWGCEEPHLRLFWVKNVSYVLHQEWFVVPLVALIYAAAFFIARWQLIAWPMRLELKSWIGDVNLSLHMEPPTDHEKQRKLTLLTDALKDADQRLNRVRLLDRVFWSRGQELANYRHVIDVDCELPFMQSAARVRARLESYEQQLRDSSTKRADALADRIHNELDGPLDSASDERSRDLLSEAIGAIRSGSVADYDDGLVWHNKTVWLVGLGILLLISLEGAKRGGGGLFALGGAGGFLSRLLRALKQNDTPTDQGAYWTTLFLSPLEGALAGWTGILLIELAHKLGVLGSAFAGITLQAGYGDLALALAFMLGFSERFFDKILQSDEKKIAKEDEASSSSSSTSSGSSRKSGSSAESFPSGSSASSGSSLLSARPSSSSSGSSSSSSSSI